MKGASVVIATTFANDDEATLHKTAFGAIDIATATFSPVKDMALDRRSVFRSGFVGIILSRRNDEERPNREATIAADEIISLFANLDPRTNESLCVEVNVGVPQMARKGISDRKGRIEFGKLGIILTRKVNTRVRKIEINIIRPNLFAFDNAVFNEIVVVIGFEIQRGEGNQALKFAAIINVRVIGLVAVIDDLLIENVLPVSLMTKNDNVAVRKSLSDSSSGNPRNDSENQSDQNEKNRKSDKNDDWHD